MENSLAWRSLCISVESRIEDAIRILNDVGLKIVLVVDHNQKLVGTISDGDIRRGLLKGEKLSSPLNRVVQRQPICASETTSRDELMKLMTIHKTFQIPIIDKDRKILGLHLWDEIYWTARKSNRFVIMAGGKGTRLLPKTEKIPKPMLPIGGKPVLEHIIMRAKKEGFVNFTISVHHLSEIIERHFGDGSSFGVNISYLRELSPLGTAGSLSLMEPVPNESLIVVNGDILTELSFTETLRFHLQNEAVATMAVQIHEWQNPFGVVRTRGIEIIGYEEKPVQHSLVNAGVYILEPEVLNLIGNSTPMSMPSLFDSIRERGLRTVAYPIYERWIDIGQPDDFDRASNEMR